MISKLVTQYIDVGFFKQTLEKTKNKKTRTKQSQINPLRSTQLSLFQRNNIGKPLHLRNASAPV